MKNSLSTRLARLALILVLFLLVPVAVQANDSTITLRPGWNFISTPRLLETGNNTPLIFKDVNTSGRSIWQYDAQAQHWEAMNASTRVNMLDGFWIYSNTTMDIPLFFSQDPPGTPPAKQVWPGWNAIGFSDIGPCSAKSALMSVNPNWTQMIGYNATTQGYEVSIINGATGIHSDSREMLPAQGYWLNMTGNGVLAACGGCADSDGDGFSDVSEEQDYLDLNYNGVYDAGTDFRFPHADFTLINHTGTGTGVLGPAPTNTGSPVEPADVKITIVSTGATNVATFNYSINGSIPTGTMVMNRSIDLPGNVRLYFSNGTPEPSFVAGDTYTFSAGVNAKVADKGKPNIYVQYDYMVLPDQGTACTTAGDCNPGQYCIAGVCKGHSDGPDPAAIYLVVEAFRRKGITLYVDPVHNELTHSKVVTYGPPVDGCAGVAPFSTDMAVDFYDIKAVHMAALRKPVFHYVVFGHLNTCDSALHCSSGCAPPQAFRSAGLSENVGNDLIVSLGGRLDVFGGVPPPSQDWKMNQGGTFMHELGHNLGLGHGGYYALEDSETNLKPNYLSVMNYLFQFSGIPTAASPGSIVPVSYRLDYQDIDPSGSILPDLDENNLSEPDGISSGTNDITYYACPIRTAAPGSGPIDWNCDGNSGSTGVVADINMDSHWTRLKSHRDWPYLQYRFQWNAATYSN